MCGPGRPGKPVTVLRETRHCLHPNGESIIGYLLGIRHTRFHSTAKVNLMETENCSDFIQWSHE